MANWGEDRRIALRPSSCFGYAGDIVSRYTHDVIVIGGGAAGLTAAGGCGMFGLKVALIEGHKMGGECLNNGCVPSKALIAVAKRVAQARSGTRMGVSQAGPTFAWSGVREWVQEAIRAIEPHDSPETFEKMGCEVILGRARLTGPHAVEVNGKVLTAPRIVLATGSEPALPPIPGLDQVPVLTNENLFELDQKPDHLIIIGGGVIGMEMGQAFARLCCQVTVIEPGELLSRDDRDSVATVQAVMEAEGVRFVRDKAVQVGGPLDGKPGAIRVTTDKGEHIEGTRLLVATGRKARVAGYGLEELGIELGANGIKVDARRRTSLKHIYAIGDCREGPRLTHAAGYEGSNVVLEVALGLPAKADWRALPWCTYTDPEVAQIGLTETQAREKYGDRLTVVTQHFDHNDRAIAEGLPQGQCKVMLKGKRVVGASLCGPGAGDLLLPFTSLITGKTGSFAMGGAVIAYPTRAEIVKAAMFKAWEPSLFGKWPRRWAAFVACLRRLV
ncbi:MAG: FAD-dependent oxidoreductase [Erythrobacter sp.]|nr:FAD-dependent oxidoreductase [Erythrobacter sp.]